MLLLLVQMPAPFPHSSPHTKANLCLKHCPSSDDRATDSGVSCVQGADITADKQAVTFVFPYSDKAQL